MPSADRRSFGRFGEAAAAAYLVRHGYIIQARNWRCSAGEIDLVATLGDQVIFVEVRTRRGLDTGSPAESVTSAKQARLAALAYHYLDAHGRDRDVPWRIDLIAVAVDNSGRVAALDHIMGIGNEL